MTTKPRAKKHSILSLATTTVPYMNYLKESHLKHGKKLDKICIWPDDREAQPDYIFEKSSKMLKKNF